jgi:hypothetical protein
MPIILPSGFQITNTDPVDARFTVTNQAARYALAPANIYLGLLVYQQDVQLTFLLIDTANVANASGWQALITGGSSISGSQTISGSLTVLGSITGSLQGTASYASFAQTASYFSGSITNAISSSYALSASYADTASYFSGSITNAISSSYALTASYVTLAQTASYFSGSITNADSASYAITASFSLYAITSSFSLTSSILSYEGTTARVSSTLSSIFLIQSGSNTVFNIDSTGSLTTSGSIFLITTGSFSNLLLIKNNDIDYVKVNGEGVLQLNQYATPPTAVTGGLYFDNGGNFYIGI